MHFLTLTANLLAEYTFELATWSPGQTQRARSEFFQVGGKGVNVTKMLRRLGATSEAVVFPGGDTGRQCVAWMNAQGLPHRAYPFEQPTTRVGLAVRAPGIAETTFLGCDRPLPESAVAACAADLAREPAGTVLALCGSVPGWDSPGGQTLAQALAQWLAAGRRLVVDTYGPPLAWLAGQPVQLVKINRKEFDGLVPPRRDGDSPTGCGRPPPRELPPPGL
jgi:Fructose-1-phosphate kinase and related fructose-6-phosphate kinase (PfkB)